MTAPAPELPGSRAQGPAGPVEYVVTGVPEGDVAAPATVFVHGLTGSVAETRPFGSGVAGRRAFVALRGSGRTAMPADPGTIADLAAEVLAVARRTGARAALGVSLGAAAVCRALVDAPGSFDRAVLCLPVAPDAPQPEGVLASFDSLAAALEVGDVEAAARLLRAQQPGRVRGLPAVALWSRRRAAELVAQEAAGAGTARALRTYPRQAPLPDAEALRAVRTPVLVVAQEDDPLHPVAAAERLVALLPGARLEVLGAGGVPWCERARLRTLVAGFLPAGRGTDAGDTASSDGTVTLRQ